MAMQIALPLWVKSANLMGTSKDMRANFHDRLAPASSPVQALSVRGNLGQKKNQYLQLTTVISESLSGDLSNL